MNNDERKMLTEWLGEEWTDPGNPKHSNRTFTEPDDMMACKDRLAAKGKGLWRSFELFAHCIFMDEEYTKPDSEYFTCWLMNPERFCQLVSDFLKEGNDE